MQNHDGFIPKVISRPPKKVQQSKKQHFPILARPGLSGEGETLQKKCTSVFTHSS